MPQVVVSPERVTKVWNWCCEAYSKVGHILRFPQNTNPQKTYQWRYAEKLAQRLEEWDFDDQTCRVFIDHVAAYAKEKGLLRKGLSAFCQSNILEVCYNRLEKSHQRTESYIDSLTRSKSFLNKHHKRGSILKGLLDRASPDAFFNMVTWYDTGRISSLYMALSESCTKALARIATLDPDQRSMLPSRSELFIARTDFVSNTQQAALAREALGDDWRELCL